MNNIIKMPSTEEEYRALANNFYQYRYPNVIGAIDGTSISVKVPEKHKIDYMTRKFVTAVNLTAVCDANKKYLDVTVGFSASCHDAHFQIHRFSQVHICGQSNSRTITFTW